MRVRWHALPTAAEAAEAACRQVVAWVEEQAAGPLTMVLAGGRTPRLLYRLLARSPLPWERLVLIPSDERCLPAGHPERNDTLLAAELLDRLPRRPVFHPIPAELGPERGAAAFEPLLPSLPPLGVAILGLGEDGHTASLFPGHPALAATTRAAPVRDAPKPPRQRVTLTLAALNEAAHAIFLVTGSGKRAALARWQAGEPLPAARVCPRGTLAIVADRLALPSSPGEGSGGPPGNGAHG